MGTSIERALNETEVARMAPARQAMTDLGYTGCATRFTFFAAFDGTNNDRDQRELSGDPFPTNVARLQEQAERADNRLLESEYYPGVGTGGDQGGRWRAGPFPTAAIDATAEQAYADFSDAAQRYLKQHPSATSADLGTAVTGFSRGCASALRFAQLVHERGIVAADGTVVAPPGSVPVTAMALIDPVARFVKGPTHIARNVQGPVLVVQAEHERRSDFRPLDFTGDPRVTMVKHPGNHVGVGGGYDAHGTGASVLEGVTGFFLNRGVPMAEVAPAHRHDAAQPQWVRTEEFQTARNGERTEQEDGTPRRVWPADDPSAERVQARPRVPAHHEAWLRQAYTALAPTLRQQGLSPGQCLQVAAACVCNAAKNARWGEPQRFLVDPNAQRVGVQHQNLRMEELSVREALERDAMRHLDAAKSAEEEALRTTRAHPLREREAAALQHLP